jgi:protoheme IX farnesyltransferase
MAFFLAAPGSINRTALALLLVGGFLVTSAANALNQALEKDYDKLMKRTADRPVAAGRMAVSEAVLWAGFMSLSGIILLAMLHPMAGFFGTLSLVTYAFIYTPVKRISPIAVAIGAVPGAMPMLIGSVVAEGEITTFALTLFAFQFFWQFPHFWAIGWLGFDDYQRAGFKLLPSINGERDKNTGLQSFIYALPLVFLPFVLLWMGKATFVSAVILAVLGSGFAFLGWKMYRENTREAARSLMFGSFAYLPLVLIVLLIEKWIF